VAADFPAGPPTFSWDQYQTNAEHRAACLDSLLSDGFALVTGVSAEPGMVLEVAGSMGFVRETNYGRLFDVQAKVDPPGPVARGGQAVPVRGRTRLCEPLSPASVCTLGVPGGPMHPDELADFAASPHAEAACRIRRWDDAAKDPDVTTPPFDHFRPMLTRLLRSAG
jgi:hypothetical protein